MYDPPSPVCGATGRANVFWEHEGRLLWTCEDGAGWTTRCLPVDGRARAPRAIAVHPALQVFWREQESGELALSAWNGRSWKTETGVSPLPILGEPAPVDSMISANAVEVYWRDSGRALQCSALSPEGWESERISEGPAISSPAPVAGWTQVFWRGEERQLIATVWGAAGWRDDRLSDGPVADTPAVVSGVEPHRLDIFWRRAGDDALVDTVFKKGGDGGPAPSGLLELLADYFAKRRRRARVWDEPLTTGPLGGPPAPVTGLAEGRVDVFWRHRDDASLRDTWWTGGVWQTAPVAQGPLGSAPAPLLRSAPKRLDVFWRELNGGLARTTWTGSEGSTQSLPGP